MYLGKSEIATSLWVKIKSKIAGVRIALQMTADERKQWMRREEEMRRKTIEAMEKTKKRSGDYRSSAPEGSRSR